MGVRDCFVVERVSNVTYGMHFCEWDGAAVHLDGGTCIILGTRAGCQYAYCVVTTNAHTRVACAAQVCAHLVGASVTTDAVRVFSAVSVRFVRPRAKLRYSPCVTPVDTECA